VPHLLRSVVGAALLLWLAPSTRAATAPLSQRVANYDIDARLDTVKHVVTAHEVLTWRNTSKEAAPDLYFHLYLNAFANSQSSFLREADDDVRDWMRDKPDGWGYQLVRKLMVNGSDRTAAIQYVHPDDDDMADRTVIRVPLGRRVAAGATARIEIDFTAKLPKVFARSGYAGPFFMVAQWFPKIGVYEEGGWNCHQYRLTTEFFADFGVYDVRLTVPRDSVVGATGTRQDEHDNGDGTKTLRYRAEDVHDFAWSVDPRFLDIKDHFKNVRLRLLLQPDHVAQAQRFLGAAKATLQRYDAWFGAYPYPQLTIVDPGPGAAAAGGMEYPTLITTGSTWWMPAGLRFPEMVTVHEIGHQYWYGMVANNEFEAAWLDEGINSYVEALVMADTYGQRGGYADLLGLKVDGLTAHRIGYVMAAQHDPIARYGWQFLNPESYGAITYGKTALMLATLERHLGRDRMLAALRTYFERWRFRHPTGLDFLNTMSEAAGEDLSWYFDQTVFGTGVLDYAVTRVEAEEVLSFSGTQVPPGPKEEPMGAVEERRYRNEVVVERLGAVRMPVDIKVGFEDGSEANEKWDGRDRWRRFEYMGPQRVEYAVVDPDRKLPLDVNVINNSKMRATGTRGIVRLAARWGFWFQNLLYFLTGL
jgi:Peptidase family M1 domain